MLNILEVSDETKLKNPKFEEIKDQVFFVFDSLYCEFYDYFEQFKKEINGKQWYTCNGADCDNPKEITSAVIRYIAQRSDFRRLNPQSSLTEILFLKNAYSKLAIPLEDLKLINPNDLSEKTKVLVNGTTFFESKSKRISDLELGDYVKVINDPEVFTSMDDTSQLFL
jgi:hypothetical protein